MTRRWLVTLSIGAVLLSGCGAREGEVIGSGQPFSRKAQLRDGPAAPPIPFVADDAIVDQSGTHRLARSIGGGLMGWLAPLAVPGPQGSLIAYNAWEDYFNLDPEKSLSAQGIQSGDAVGRPSIRLYDLDSGGDELLADGAFSLAWHSDGGLAYFQGSTADFRVNEPYAGDIVVRSDVSAPPTPWTLVPGDYVVVAWAGDALIAYERREGGNLDVIMLAGPGDVRRLASSAQVVALSPDGTQALLDAYGTGSSVATLIDLSTGEELARLDFSDTMEPGTSKPLDSLSYGGSWIDDRVVAQAGPGFVVLDTSDDSLRLDGVLRLGAEFPLGAIEPLFMSGSTTRFVAWAPKVGSGGKAGRYLYVYLDCSLETFECLVGPPRGDRMFNPVRNPSRPMPEEGQ